MRTIGRGVYRQALMSRLLRSGWKLPQLTLHQFDFLQLFNDYALSKPAQDWIFSKLQF